MSAQEIYEENIGGVVEIVSTFSGGYDMWGQPTGDQQGIGTGFVVSEDGYILTNAHVVSESGVTASSVTVVFKGEGEDGTQVPATIVGSDESTDVALLKIDPSQAPGPHRRQARRFVRGLRRRAGRRHRQPARPRLLALQRRRLRRRP